MIKLILQFIGAFMICFDISMYWAAWIREESRTGILETAFHELRQSADQLNKYYTRFKYWDEITAQPEG